MNLKIELFDHSTWVTIYDEKFVYNKCYIIYDGELRW